MALRNRVIAALLMATGFVSVLSAQETTELTLADAFRHALAHNYDIRIASTDVRIARQRTGLGHAGFLPRVDANASWSKSVSDTTTTPGSGPTVQANDVESESTRASLDLSYVLFNGFANFNLLRQFDTLAALSELQAKLVMEDTLIRVASAYYDVVRAQEQAAASEEILALSEARLTQLQNRRELGLATQLEVLTAEVNRDADESQLLNARLFLEVTRKDLNFLIGFPLTATPDIEEAVAFSLALPQSEIRRSMFDRNTLWLIQQKNETLSDIAVNLAYSAFYPTILLTGQYGYSRTESEAGSVRLSKSNGYTIGAQLTWNLFNGFQDSDNVRISELERFKTLLQEDKLTDQLELNLSRLFDTYHVQRVLVAAEARNLERARLVLESVRETYSLGRVTALELREAQLNVLDAAIRHSNAIYLAKLSELELYRLSGLLVN